MRFRLKQTEGKTKSILKANKKTTRIETLAFVVTT